MQFVYLLRLWHYQSLDAYNKVCLLHADKILPNLKERLRNSTPTITDEQFVNIIINLIRQSSAELENHVEQRLQLKLDNNYDTSKSKLSLLQELLVEEAKRTENVIRFVIKDKAGLTIRLYDPPPEDVSRMGSTTKTIPRTTAPSQYHHPAAMTNYSQVLPQDSFSSNSSNYSHMPITNFANLLLRDSVLVPANTYSQAELAAEQVSFGGTYHPDPFYNQQAITEVSPCIANSLLPVTTTTPICSEGCGLSHHTIQNCPVMRRNATTGEIQQEFPLNPWLYA